MEEVSLLVVKRPSLLQQMPYILDMTLFGVAKVASIVDVSRPTIYSWIEHGLVSHRYTVDGAPAFTPSECTKIARLAEQRRRAREKVRLPGRPLGRRK